MIKIGIVGLGFIGKAHLEAFRHMAQVEVVAICTKQAEGVGIDDFHGEVVSDYEQLLQREDIAVIDICVPTFLHEDYIIRAAEAGKQIICEKPLTLTVAAANRIIEAVRRSNVRLFVGHVLRFWPEYETIKSLHDTGKLKGIETIHAQRLGQLPTWSDWFQHPEKSGGALFDLHLHDIDFAYYLLGEVETVYAVGHQNQYGAWDHVMSTLTFQNKAKAFIEASHRMPNGYPFTMAFRAQGQEGAIDFHLKAGENIEKINDRHFVFYDKDQVEEVAVETADAFQQELAYFITCIEQEKENTVIPVADVLYSLNLLKLIEQSLETGREIHVPATSFSSN